MSMIFYQSTWIRAEGNQMRLWAHSCFNTSLTSWSLLGPGVEVGLTPSFID